VEILNSEISGEAKATDKKVKYASTVSFIVLGYSTIKD